MLLKQNWRKFSQLGVKVGILMSTYVLLAGCTSMYVCAFCVQV
jgi:hypothetical protein